MKLEEYLVHGCFYDPSGQDVFLNDGSGGINKFVDIRGWGHIQGLFENMSDAMEFQDVIGQFVADAINEKIDRDFN